MKENLYMVSMELNGWIGKADFLPNIDFPWDEVSVAKEVKAKFQMTIKWKRLKKIELDFFGTVTPIVSNKFAYLCNEQNIDCQLVPLDIILNGVEVVDKFYFLLLNKFISIVDMEKTKHVRMMMRDGKGYEINHFFPKIPEYDMLENIIINDIQKPNFFVAPEIGYKRVCTQSFKDCVENHKIKGMEFKLIDSNFKYQSLFFEWNKGSGEQWNSQPT